VDERAARFGRAGVLHVLRGVQGSRGCWALLHVGKSRKTARTDVPSKPARLIIAWRILMPLVLCVDFRDLTILLHLECVATSRRMMVAQIAGCVSAW